MSTVAPDLDPFTYEILRHRLWAINDEAATTIARVSGSPVANESYDFNAALLTAASDVVVIGHYVMAHAAALDCVVRHIAREYAENPGIGPGDMFMTNDPYVGAMHQPDVALVAPIFDGDRLIMWCGSIVHQTDVGGPVAGSVTAGARSIYEEAIPLAPVKIVEAGRVRKDIEREYLIRSRMPQLNALDLRGQIAANNVQTERVLALCHRYGTEVVLAAIERMVGATRAQFGRRLAELPDGRWHHRSFIEHDGIEDEVYAVDLVMTKQGDHLDLDFTGSSDQAPSLINSSVGTLRGYTLAAVLTLLGYDLPWVPAGYWPHITLRTRPGSIVDAAWPAGVSMGNTASGHNIRTAVNMCIAMMMDASPAYHGRAMASCIGSFSGQNISGTRRGQRFGTMLLDSLAGGGGASAAADGVNTAGQINAPASAIGNVETNEYHYPMLYLWRREAADSGGPGRHRGGVGGEHAYVLHDADGPMECTLFAHGVEQPTSAGVAGGDPGGPNGFAVFRGARTLTAQSVEELRGEMAVPPPKAVTSVGPDDVFVHWYAGGGGFGDPLEREPSLVLDDVVAGLVTPEGAARDYGVVVTDDPGEVDLAATERRRRQARKDRLAGREPAAVGGAESDEEHRRALSSTLSVHETSDGARVSCRRCGTDLGAAGHELLALLTTDEQPVGERWPRTGLQPGAERFVLRRHVCPACGSCLHTSIDLGNEAPRSPIEIEVVHP